MAGRQGISKWAGVPLLLLVLTGSLGVSVRQQWVERTAIEPVVITESVIESEMPDFGSIYDVKAKKTAFFSYMKPIVEAENRGIGTDRVRLKGLIAKASLSQSDRQWLQSLAKEYRLPLVGVFTPDWFAALLKRVDTLPVSMALAQAANESAWGTSRFAREGNNLFGQWCFSKGCGLVPNQRSEGADHEVRKFDSVADSVEAYLLNLNSHREYADLRSMRAEARQEQQPVTGLYLSPGLVSYSERGEAYVEELMAMISGNNLEKHDVALASMSRPAG